MATDPIILGAQAREMLAGLHQRNDTVVRLKTNTSGFAFDATDSLDERAPGHFRAEQKVLTLNLDTLIRGGKALPKSLDKIEDWRKYPVLTGVAAHESAHARFSLWDHEVPESIPNPDYDPADPASGPEEYPVRHDGALMDLAKRLEEPRAERLGLKHFSKTWRRGMQFSASHLILESVEEDDASGVDPIGAALNLMILVGGREIAGTLGATFDSRQAVKKVMGTAQALIESALAEKMSTDPTFDPFHQIMRVVSDATFNDEHTDPTVMLEYARQIVTILRPDQKDDPDGGKGDEGDEENESGGGKGGVSGNPGGSAEGPDSEDGDEESGEGEGKGEHGEGGSNPMLDALKEAMQEALDEMVVKEREAIKKEESQPEGLGGGGVGATLYRDPKAPRITGHEKPNADDRAMYRKALAWMEKQVQPTITESMVNQWLPTGGARLDVRSYVRDNIADHRATQRSDWARPQIETKPAPPVKVAIMLDGSGSMRDLARTSASIGWAAANAAAQLPESRTISVVYGAAAAVTQKPGHGAIRDVAVCATNGPWENFGQAVELVEEGLRLNDPIVEGERENVMIIIVSDLIYGGIGAFRGDSNAHQSAVFNTVSKEWAERGYQVLVVGTRPTNDHHRYGVDDQYVRKVTVAELFR